MYHRTRTAREKSPWAVISILIVIILFGMFWLWQQQQLQMPSDIGVAPTQQPVVAAPQKGVTPSVDDLQASAANIAIPSFEKVL